MSARKSLYDSYDSEPYLLWHAPHPFTGLLALDTSQVQVLFPARRSHPGYCRSNRLTRRVSLAGIAPADTEEGEGEWTR